MTRILIHYSDGRQIPIELHKNEMLIGRDAGSCDVVLEDAVTSRQHARLESDSSGHIWIHDLHSKNGTTVNERAITRAQLRPGDRVGIGGCFLTLDGDGLAAGIILSEPDIEVTSATTNAWDNRHRIALPQQRLEKLYELNERLSGRFDRDDLLTELLDASIELLRFERAGVGVWEGPSHSPEWVVFRNLRGDAHGECRISRSLVDRALTQGERILMNDVAGQSFDPTASMISNNIQSAMCVPMVSQGRVVGVMYGDRVSSAGGYTREDTDFFAALARLGAMGLTNIQLLEVLKSREQMETQIKWARRIQEDLFPAEPLIQPGLRVAGVNDPGQRISGDYFDYFPRPDGSVVLVMADVMGKGIPASLLMANLQAAVHVKLIEDVDLADAIRQINSLICRNVSDSRFITGLFGILCPTSGVFRYVNAGHMPPYVARPGENAEMIDVPAALPLGVETDYPYESGEFRLDRRPATIFLYTDGIPDAESEGGERFENDRLRELLTTHADRPPEDLLGRIRTSIRQFTRNHEQTDDITMLAARLG